MLIFNNNNNVSTRIVLYRNDQTNPPSLMIAIYVFDGFLNNMQLWRSLFVTLFLCALTPSQAFLQNGWPENYQLTDGESFDFIVVGSGSAGSVVAARLSEISNFITLLIETGGDPPFSSVLPGGFFLLQGNDNYDYNYEALFNEGVGQAHPGGFLPYHRGKMLGGCSSTNYLMYSRGVPEDYEIWNRGAPGWDWNTVLYYFKKLENMTDLTLFENPQNADLHSKDGPVKVSRPETPASYTAIDNSRLDCYEEMGIEHVLENNGPEICGAARPHYTLYEGRRYSTAEAYLRPVKDRSNLKVAKFSTVIKVLIDPQTMQAYGVRVFTSNNQTINVYADKEVILSAGTIDSPKILLQSGIGPQEELSKLGLETLVDLPVGKNFHDHLAVPLIYKGKRGILSAWQNLVAVTQLHTLPAPVQCGFFRANSSLFDQYPSKLQPHFQFYNSYFGAASPALSYGCKAIINFDNNYCLSQGAANVFNEIDNLLLILLHPKSRGQVKLRSADPHDKPIIDLGYYTDLYDLKVVTEGVKYMNTFTNTSCFSNVQNSIPRLHVTGCEDVEWGSDEYWECYSRNSVLSMLHGVGTCSMPTDDNSGVVDEFLRVHNVTGLRVVDASVIPLIPSGNTNAPVMMIGEKAADMIKADYCGNGTECQML